MHLFADQKRKKINSDGVTGWKYLWNDEALFLLVREKLTQGSDYVRYFWCETSILYLVLNSIPEKQVF